MKTFIGFSTPKTFNPFSWVIRTMTGSKASHAWLSYYDVNFDCEMVLDAHETGYRLIPMAVFVEKNQIVAHVDPAHDLTPGLKQALEWLGSMYDYAGLVGTAVVLLGRWLKRKWKNPIHTNKQMFCSESVVRILQASGFPGADSLDPESTTPQDLLDFITCR